MDADLRNLFVGMSAGVSRIRDESVETLTVPVKYCNKYSYVLLRSQSQVRGTAHCNQWRYRKRYCRARKQPLFRLLLLTVIVIDGPETKAKVAALGQDGLALITHNGPLWKCSKCLSGRIRWRKQSWIKRLTRALLAPIAKSKKSARFSQRYQCGRTFVAPARRLISRDNEVA